jgi:hypothetical protein
MYHVYDDIIDLNIPMISNWREILISYVSCLDVKCYRLRPKFQVPEFSGEEHDTYESSWWSFSLPRINLETWRGLEDAARVKQQSPMHQFRMRLFKSFWGWTKNTSFCLAQGLSAPFSAPKFSFPTYSPPSYLLPSLLPTSALLPPSPHFLLTPSPKLRRAHELE